MDKVENRVTLSLYYGEISHFCTIYMYLFLCVKRPQEARPGPDLCRLGALILKVKQSIQNCVILRMTHIQGK
jgi:hypothetical protein